MSEARRPFCLNLQTEFFRYLPVNIDLQSQLPHTCVDLHNAICTVSILESNADVIRLQIHLKTRNTYKGSF